MRPGKAMRTTVADDLSTLGSNLQSESSAFHARPNASRALSGSSAAASSAGVSDSIAVEISGQMTTTAVDEPDIPSPKLNRTFRENVL